MNDRASRFDHPLSTIGPCGVVEHAIHERARREHGYDVDDVARVLLFAVRETERSDATVELVNVSLPFVKRAQSGDGGVKNRRTTAGVFLGVRSSGDGRAKARPLTGDDEKSAAIELSVQWFLGNNDLGGLMCDSLSGGGYDRLTANGRNQNRGAASTLALLATLRRAQQPELAS